MYLMDNSLAIPFSNNVTKSKSLLRQPFVHLEQIKQPKSAETATMTDISMMIARARTGLSARTYKPENCAGAISGDTISVWFDFYVWPSAENLPYALTSSLGNISQPKIIHKQTQFSVTFELSDKVELDFIMDDFDFSYTWETDCYNSRGVRLDKPPELVLENYHTIRASRPVFGVARISGRKRGSEFTLTQRMVKTVPVNPDGSLPDEEEFNNSGAGDYYTYQEWLEKFYGVPESEEDGVPRWPTNLTGLRISNLNVSVTAHYFGLGGKSTSETLKLEVPKCIEDLLAACGVDTDGDGIIDSWDEDAIFRSTLTICGPDDDPPTIVYISGCTGKVIGARSAGDDDSGDWCGHRG